MSRVQDAQERLCSGGKLLLRCSSTDIPVGMCFPHSPRGHTPLYSLVSADRTGATIVVDGDIDKGAVCNFVRLTAGGNTQPNIDVDLDR